MISVLKRRKVLYRQRYKWLFATVQQIIIHVAGEQIVLCPVCYWIKQHKDNLIIRECNSNDYTELVLNKKDITAIEGVYQRGERVIYKKYSYQ